MRKGQLLDLLRRAGIEPVSIPSTEEGWLTFLCPFPHGRSERDGRILWRFERRPSAGASFNASGKPSGWHCFGCKRHGSIAGLFRSLHRELGAPVQELAALASSLEAAHQVEEEPAGPRLAPLPPPLGEEHEDLFEPLAHCQEALDYVRRRGCDPESLIDRLGVAWDPDQRRIVFPVRDREGRLYGYTGRAIDPGVEPRIRDYYGLPKRHLVLGEHRWRDGAPIFLVEGLFGLARLVSIGAEAHANLGALLGSVLTPEKAYRISSWDLPVFLAFDPDEGGDAGLFGPLRPDGSRDSRRGAIALARSFGIETHVPAWPEGVDDPDRLDLDQVLAMLEAPAYGIAERGSHESVFSW